jgi:hypothetical protein
MFRFTGAVGQAQEVLSFPTNSIVQMGHKSGLLAALVSLVARVGAAYIMDDTNSTISYSPPGQWNRVNDSALYNGT